jgi:hypothetical protein
MAMGITVAGMATARLFRKAFPNPWVSSARL